MVAMGLAYVRDLDLGAINSRTIPHFACFALLTCKYLHSVTSNASFWVIYFLLTCVLKGGTPPEPFSSEYNSSQQLQILFTPKSLQKNVSLFSVPVVAEDGFHLPRFTGNVSGCAGALAWLYCQWTLVRWTAPERMALAKRASEKYAHVLLGS